MINVVQWLLSHLHKNSNCKSQFSLQTEAAAFLIGLLKLSQISDQNNNSFSVGKL
jgi:hypothetical protein